MSMLDDEIKLMVLKKQITDLATLCNELITISAQLSSENADLAAEVLRLRMLTTEGVRLVPSRLAQWQVIDGTDCGEGQTK